jgi:signal transduction histidine kinase
MELEVTGIADIRFSPADESANFARPLRVDLLLRGVDDIVILSHPSWWTVKRALNALVIAAGSAILAFVWAFTLRRSLTRQTARLAVEMRDRRDAALEFQAAIRERTRLAANLHDTVLQTMAGIGYQLEACGQIDRHDSKQLNAHLETASRMVQHGQDSLRNTVWALHCLPLEEGTFLDSVRQVTRSIGLGHETKMIIHCDDGFPALADFIAGNLLLVIQEASCNAIKHARAKTIEINLDATLENVTVSVHDDGIGFDPHTRRTSRDGHFGIEGMEERVSRLGGDFILESEPGGGTTVRVDVPLHAFDPHLV